ncbi:hydrolase [bacterium]|nr:hydrolase [bacterium]
MINTENTVFLMIDIQEKLVYMLKNSAEIAKNNFVMANAASILNVPVILTEQYPQGLGSIINQVKSFVDENNIFEKTSFSALNVEEVKSALEKTGRKKVVLSGIETHICVYQTARALLDAGYEVYVVKNACASRSKKDYRTALELMRDYGAKLTCVETVLFELLGSSKHPNFKEVQLLIK